MSPTYSGSHVADFWVFKRRKKIDPRTNTKTDTKNGAQTNTQEESLEEKGSHEQTTVVLTGLPTTSFSHIVETTESPISSTS